MTRVAGLALVLLVCCAQGSEAAAPSRGVIAFALRGRDDNDAIYTVRPDGSRVRQLTRPQVRQGYGGDTGPVWSPDGRRLAFERNLPSWGEDRFRVHVIRTNGRGERPLTVGPFDVMPAWSPDSTRLAYVRLVIGETATYSSIYALTLRGETRELISGTADVSPTWSPNGRSLAFTRLVDGAEQLVVADLADGSVRRLGVAGAQPAWSPDGRRLAFVSYLDANGATCVGDDCAPNGEIYVVGADGKDLRRITRSAADDAHPSWSPDGRFLAFSSGYEVHGHPPWLMTVASNGGKPRRITRLTGVHDPAWSPATVR